MLLNGKHYLVIIGLYILCFSQWSRNIMLQKNDDKPLALKKVRVQFWEVFNNVKDVSRLTNFLITWMRQH
jgi:hypothetical protein